MFAVDSICRLTRKPFPGTAPGLGKLSAGHRQRDPPPTASVYQRITADAAALERGAVRVAAIARHFGVDHHTADKVIRWFRRR